MVRERLTDEYIDNHYFVLVKDLFVPVDGRIVKQPRGSEWYVHDVNNGNVTIYRDDYVITETTITMELFQKSFEAIKKGEW